MGGSSSKKKASSSAPVESVGDSARRVEIAKEILTTERTYVEMMQRCVEVYLEPLRGSTKTKKPILKQKHIPTIFGIFEELLTTHQALLGELETVMDEKNPKIGAFFVANAGKMKQYSVYVNNYGDAIQCMVECQSKYTTFNDFLQTTLNSPESNGLGLGSYLILPIQRIPRYVLLLEDLIKNTDKKHPDHKQSLIALDEIREVADYVNEEKRIAEQMEELIRLKYTLEGFKGGDLVQRYRAFVREGDSKVRSEKKQEFSDIHFYLFNDMILLTLETISSSLLPFQFFGKEDNRRFKVVGMADLLDTDIVDMKDKHDQKNAMSLRCDKTNYIFIFETPEEKEKWLDELYSLRARAPSKKDKQAAIKEAAAKKKKK